MFTGVHHVTYVVNSVDEMAEYLEKNFGLKPERIEELPARGVRTSVYRVGSTIMDFEEPFLDEHGEAIIQGGAAMMFAKMLRETGPGLFHVAWAVEGIDRVFEELKNKGNKMDPIAHDNPLHGSILGYKCFNIIPSSIGPSYSKAIRGVFFQLAEGDIATESEVNEVHAKYEKSLVGVGPRSRS